MTTADARELLTPGEVAAEAANEAAADYPSDTRAFLAHHHLSLALRAVESAADMCGHSMSSKGLVFVGGRWCVNWYFVVNGWLVVWRSVMCHSFCLFVLFYKDLYISL